MKYNFVFSEAETLLIRSALANIQCHPFVNDIDRKLCERLSKQMDAEISRQYAVNYCKQKGM